MDDFGNYINTIDIDYDSEVFSFTGYVYEFNTPQFNVVKGSVYAKVLRKRKKLLKVMDKTVIYQFRNVIYQMY